MLTLNPAVKAEIAANLKSKGYKVGTSNLPYWINEKELFLKQRQQPQNLNKNLINKYGKWQISGHGDKSPNNKLDQ